MGRVAGAEQSDREKWEGKSGKKRGEPTLRVTRPQLRTPVLTLGEMGSL